MSTRRHLRGLAFRAARWSGVLHARERALRGRLTVPMYHRVLPERDCRDYPLRSLALPEDAFREQMRWLAGNADVLPLGAALAALRTRRSGARPLCAVTFDDGYADNARAAAPILEEHGLRGTFFVTTGFVEGRTLWFDRLADALARLGEAGRARLAAELGLASSAEPATGSPGPPGPPRPLDSIGAWMAHAKRLALAARAELVELAERSAGPMPDPARYAPMSPAEVRSLCARGHEVGSHTVEHPLLTQLRDAELERELAGSRVTLERWTGTQVTGFCYPNGSFDDRVVAAVERAGYAWACGTAEGTNGPDAPPHRLARVAIAQDRVLDAARRPDPLAFRAELCGLRRRRA
jgi:peptidoglycan/xylan/chitin deacetylase (PgdA/CDA1 family)